ncbi:biotin carboxylase N-terminal domain-containing protein [Sneathiella sp.]|uniref:acetyl/propionyl/methylcrotonyl-CoA carboxylase subunit alpha n=1 Tax=Sneathiella sp. TaxID=1964365 RepID=UPI0035697309
MKIKTLLIANRGEIACRIARTARALGITPVAVHSEADADARHVREIGRSILIGRGPASESYLNIDAVLSAAKAVGADAVHPGYGFLSENPAFARAVEAAGMLFIGPTAETLERFGDKASAKEAAVMVGVPVISGAPGVKSDPQVIYDEVLKMGLPVLLKAVGGGGGRGQRLVENTNTLTVDIEAALREAHSTFGSEGLILERFLANARHVEIQIVGDGTGTVLHLFERDCTLQRRHQKVIEEAPAFALSRNITARMAADAVRLGESLSYRGLGTVEFLIAGDAYFFLEVNPRLQVEHPVTEAVIGLDLVALQIRIAEGKGIGLIQEDITLTGHAIEARLYAEDPKSGFAPSTGQITLLTLPEDIRADSGVDENDVISPYYDPMIAKLVVHAPDRDAALAGLARALDLTRIAGVDTNREFLANLVRNDSFGEMKVHTRWIDANIDALITPAATGHALLWEAVAAVLFLMRDRCTGDSDSWRNREIFTGWQLGLDDARAEAGQRVTLSRPGTGGQEYLVTPIRTGGKFVVFDAEGTALTLSVIETGSGQWRITTENESRMVSANVRQNLIEIRTADECHLFEAAPPLAFAAGLAAIDRTLTSPLTGMIIKLLIAEGDQIEAGDTVAILESMKLEISIKATAPGRATNISITEGTMVDRGQAIVEIMEMEEADI